jgi:hypothetical protein
VVKDGSTGPKRFSSSALIAGQRRAAPPLWAMRLTMTAVFMCEH